MMLNACVIFSPTKFTFPNFCRFIVRRGSFFDRCAFKLPLASSEHDSLMMLNACLFCLQTKFSFVTFSSGGVLFSTGEYSLYWIGPFPSHTDVPSRPHPPHPQKNTQIPPPPKTQLPPTPSVDAVVPA